MNSPFQKINKITVYPMRISYSNEISKIEFEQGYLFYDFNKKNFYNIKRIKSKDSEEIQEIYHEITELSGDLFLTQDSSVQVDIDFNTSELQSCLEICKQHYSTIILPFETILLPRIDKQSKIAVCITQNKTTRQEIGRKAFNLDTLQQVEIPELEISYVLDPEITGLFITDDTSKYIVEISSNKFSKQFIVDVKTREIVHAVDETEYESQFSFQKFSKNLDTGELTAFLNYADSFMRNDSENRICGGNLVNQKITKAYGSLQIKHYISKPTAELMDNLFIELVLTEDDVLMNTDEFLLQAFN